MSTPKRPEITEDDRLAIAIRFANLDLARLSAGDWLNLRRDLDWFSSPSGELMQRHGVLVIHENRSGIDNLPVAAVTALQAEVRDLIGTVADVAVSIHPQGTVVTRSSSPTVTVTTRKSLICTSLASRPTVVLASGSVRDVVLDQLLSLLSRIPRDRIRRCPECGTIFLRVRKQLYCSRRCVNRANKRAWLATPKGQRASQASRRRTYVKQQQRKYGRKIRVRLNGKRTGSRS